MAGRGIDLVADRYLLVIGCGRSGTQYISHLLASNGYDVRHEQGGRDGCVAGSLGARHYPIQWMKRPPIAQQWAKATVVFHQVRAPLPAIVSTGIISRWNFIVEALPAVKHTKNLVRCMRYWLLWNQMCERHASWRYRVEDLKGIRDGFKGKLGWLIRTARTPTDRNTRRHLLVYPLWKREDLERADLELFKRIATQAVRYGYKDDLTNLR